MVLPPGIHVATLVEVEKRFAANTHRKQLFLGLCRGLDALRVARCSKAFLNESFVTEKPFPGDYDVCWDMRGVDVSLLDPILCDSTLSGRKRQKAVFLGEYFPASFPADPTFTFLDYFQRDSHTGEPKGIVCVAL